MRVQIGHALPRPSEMDAVRLDDHFAGTRSRVVVGAHHEAVGTGAAHGEQIARFQRELAVLREEVGALANGSYDLPAASSALSRAYGLDAVPRVVQRRAQQIVHRRVDDGEAPRRTR